MNHATASVALRAVKASHGWSRTYALSGVLHDRAGNVAESTVECGSRIRKEMRDDATTSLPLTYTALEPEVSGRMP